MGAGGSRGAAPRAWPSLPAARPAPAASAASTPHLANIAAVSFPKTAASPASWSRSRASVLLLWPPRPPLMALSAHPSGLAGELCLAGRLGRRSLTPRTKCERLGCFGVVFGTHKASQVEPVCQGRRPGFSPFVGKTP